MVLIAGYNSPQSMILIDIMIESSVSATNRRYKLTNSLFLPDTTLSCTLIPINIEGVSKPHKPNSKTRKQNKIIENERFHKKLKPKSHIEPVCIL